MVHGVRDDEKVMLEARASDVDCQNMLHVTFEWSWRRSHTPDCPETQPP